MNGCTDMYFNQKQKETTKTFFVVGGKGERCSIVLCPVPFETGHNGWFRLHNLFCWICRSSILNGHCQVGVFFVKYLESPLSPGTSSDLDKTLRENILKNLKLTWNPFALTISMIRDHDIFVYTQCSCQNIDDLDMETHSVM